MRILFTTQATSLRVFDEVRAALEQKTHVERVGYTVADSMFYRQWLRESPGFETAGHLILKEWDVTARRRGKPDLDLLARYERKVGAEAGLFGAIVADRRLFMGPDCTYTQDYRRRFTDDELLCILQEGLLATERLFDALKPDVVVGFVCVTFLEYLAYLFARSRGVRILNLRPTRIADRVIFGSAINDPAPEFLHVYRRARLDGSSCMDDARGYIGRVRAEHGRYEGVVAPSSRPALVVNPRRQSAWSAALRVTRNYREYRHTEARADNHVPDPMRSLMFAAIVNPARAWMTARQLGAWYVTEERLRASRYVFYPLHTEPEVSLLVYGRPFLNQIEVIRQIAISLPIDMQLVVKEHPWMVGKRTRSFYRKLLNIPRVHLARPEMAARELISHAALIAVVTGSVALEGVILEKPVITFGDCPFNALPSAMVRRCADLRELPSLLATMLDEHQHDEAALQAYVAAVFELSESVNLYSVLLEKKGVYVERPAARADEIRKLADYALACMRNVETPVEPAAAAW
jgi:hypothetical protein